MVIDYLIKMKFGTNKVKKISSTHLHKTLIKNETGELISSSNNIIIIPSLPYTFLTICIEKRREKL